MANYATQTKVSVAASKAEIEATLNRFGIRDVVFGTVDDGKLAAVMFQYQRRPYAISVKMPDPEERRFRHTPERGLERTQEQAYAAWEQACRVKWRELALLIKAKLVTVSNEAVNFEDEFLAYAMLPDRSTFGQVARAKWDQIAARGELPDLIALPWSVK